MLSPLTGQMVTFFILTSSSAPQELPGVCTSPGLVQAHAWSQRGLTAERLHHPDQQLPSLLPGPGPTDRPDS